MDILQAIILGLIQGLTEFIPISSTAHLTLVGKIFGLIDLSHPERWTAFIAIIQLGTLASVLLYFKKELVSVPKAFFKENFKPNREKISAQSEDSKLGWYIIIGTLPIITIGLLLKKLIESEFTKSLQVIAFSLIALAIVLFIAERAAKLKKSMPDLNWKDSLWVGLAQCVALVPGASRSGTTITAGLFLGMDRETAARFSFLLSIPAVFASGVLQFYQALEYVSSSDWLSIIIATVVSGISGYASIDFLIKYLKRNTTKLFIIYRITLGLIILGYLYFI